MPLFKIDGMEDLLQELKNLQAVVQELVDLLKKEEEPK